MDFVHVAVVWDAYVPFFSVFWGVVLLWAEDFFHVCERCGVAGDCCDCLFAVFWESVCSVVCACEFDELVVIELLQGFGYFVVECFHILLFGFPVPAHFWHFRVCMNPDGQSVSVISPVPSQG